MPIVPIWGLGQQGKAPTVTAERHLNLFAEFVPDADKTKVAFYGTPGWTLFSDSNGDTPIRGWIAIDNLIYYVHRGTLYSINNAGTRTSLGALNTVMGKVDMTFNGDNILIVDGTNGYVYSVTYGTFFQNKQISSGTTDGTSAGKLVNSGASFTTDGTKAGMVVYNTTDSTQTIISAVDNATHLSVVDDIFTTGEGYKVGDANFPDGANTCTWISGEFAVDTGDSSDIFRISADGVSWPVLDFASAESAPDGLVRVFADHGEILLFGSSTLEPWGNVGAEDFPFAAIQGSIQEIGLGARWALQKFDSAIAFLGKNKQGQVQVYRMDGYQLHVISTPEVDSLINGYATVSDAVMMSFVDRGHPFLVLNFPSARKSWMYDATTHLWSPRESGLNGDRYAGELALDFLNKIRVSDYSSGNIYTLSPTTYTENGTAIAREIVGKHFFSNYDRVIVDELRIDFETGVGVTSGQGSDPKAMLSYSKDNGRTWSAELWASIGAIGKYLTRVVWRRLGIGRDWLFKVRITDPIPVVITGAYIRAQDVGS